MAIVDKGFVPKHYTIMVVVDTERCPRCDKRCKRVFKHFETDVIERCGDVPFIYQEF